MTYTMTEESKFETRARSVVLETAVATVRNRLRADAQKAGYEHMVVETFSVAVKLVAEGGEFYATAEAVFARIVPAEWDGEDEPAPDAPGLLAADAPNPFED